MNIQFTVTRESLAASRRIDAWLAGQFFLSGKLSRQEIKTLLKQGVIFLNDKTARPSDQLRENDRVSGDIDDSFFQKQSYMVPEQMPLSIIYEDESLLVLDKPSGLVVHPGAGHKKGTLTHGLLGRGGPLSDVAGAGRPGIVHRLDKDTSGLLLVAKNNQAHRGLASQFESRSLSKTYTALVKGRVEFQEGHVDAPIGRDISSRTKMAIRDDETARYAVTFYQTVKRFRDATLLLVKPETGRTHQIRVHLASLGHPVLGDTLYGSPKPVGRLALHASKIEFSHPITGKILSFESPLPPELNKMIDEAAKA